MANEQNLTPIKDLFELLGDSRKGYAETAEKEKDSRMTGFFLGVSQERGDMQRDLGRAIHQADPETGKLDDGTFKGDLHRTWINIRQALSSADGVALLDECERGENYLLERFKTILEDKDTPHAFMDLLRAQRSMVEGTLSMVEQLRATMK